MYTDVILFQPAFFSVLKCLFWIIVITSCFKELHLHQHWIFLVSQIASQKTHSISLQKQLEKFCWKIVNNIHIKPNKTTAHLKKLEVHIIKSFKISLNKYMQTLHKHLHDSIQYSLINKYRVSKVRITHTLLASFRIR